MDGRGDEGAQRTYEAVAPFYDDFTAHHDYELWLSNLMPKLKLHGFSGQRLLDVACGTGKSFMPLLERGWEVTACDISGPMIEEARAKVGDAATLFVADMRALPAVGEFDLVMCLDDAVNYLLTTKELEQALAGMGRNLGPGGLMMFDANALFAYRTFFAEESEIERDGRRLTWKGQADENAESGSIFESRFSAVSLAGVPLIPTQTHRQRHFPEADVRAALDRAGLECVAVYGHSFDAVLEQPLDEDKHSKAVYMARLPVRS